MVACLVRVLLALCLVPDVAGYRDGTFDSANQPSSLELNSRGSMVKPKHRGSDSADLPTTPREGSSDAPASLLETSRGSLGSGPDGDGGGEGGDQGLKDEDCTVELVPHKRLTEFRDQLKSYLTSMVKEFVDKVKKQGEDHATEADRIEAEMTSKVKKTKTELVRMIRGFTIEQQRLMVITRHDISGMCCCDKGLDTSHDGKLDNEEIKSFLDSKQEGVCQWIPKGCDTEPKLQGLRGNLCPDDLRWQYRDIIGSGARVTAKEVDRIVDDCIRSPKWKEFVEGKKPFKALNDANQK